MGCTDRPPDAASDSCAAPPVANRCVWCTASRSRGRMWASPVIRHCSGRRLSTGQRRVSGMGHVSMQARWACEGLSGGAVYCSCAMGPRTRQTGVQTPASASDRLSSCTQGGTEADQGPGGGTCPAQGTAWMRGSQHGPSNAQLQGGVEAAWTLQVTPGPPDYQEQITRERTRTPSCPHTCVTVLNHPRSTS